MRGARGVGVAAARHLLAAVVLWAAFSSAASFTDPSDGTISHPSSVAIDLLPRDAYSACVSARVVAVAGSLCRAHTCGLVCIAAREPYALVDWCACVRANSGLRALVLVHVSSRINVQIWGHWIWLREGYMCVLVLGNSVPYRIDECAYVVQKKSGHVFVLVKYFPLCNGCV